MQRPFFRSTAGPDSIDDLAAVIVACGCLGVESVLVPLVDDASLETTADEERFLRGIDLVAANLSHASVKLTIESDYPPRRLARLLEPLDPSLVGVTYDTGNSAALGYPPDEEFAAYGARILNVHLKDRRLNGGTVPLGQGAADLRRVFRLLAAVRYPGNLILQTARAANGDHVGELLRNLAHIRALREETL